MRNQLIGAASAAAIGFFAFGPAFAAPAAAPSDATVVPQGVISADYNYVGAEHGGYANVGGGELAGIMPLGADFSGQLIGGYQNYSFGGGNVNDWNIAGTASWDNQRGRLGVNVGYTGLNGFGADVDVTNYGAYGEYYASDRVTAGLRAGGVTASANALGFGGGGSTGGYVGGQLIGYLTPDFDLQGHAGYVGLDGGEQTNVGVQAEYLFSETMPVSGFVGYDYTHFGDDGLGVDENIFSVGLKFYVGGGGPLVARQRSGVDSWAGSALDLER